jgi:hypothetical protein
VPNPAKVISLKRKDDFLVHGVVLQNPVFQARDGDVSRETFMRTAEATAGDVSRETIFSKTAFT